MVSTTKPQREAFLVNSFSAAGSLEPKRSLGAWVEWRRGLRSQTGMGWVESPSHPPLRLSKLRGGRWFQILTASGKKMVSDGAGEGGQSAARGESWCASLTSLSFLHSTDLLRAEYLISTPFITSTDGTGRDSTGQPGAQYTLAPNKDASPNMAA